MAPPAQRTVEANVRWFTDNDGYVEAQSRLVHYQHIARMVQHELRGVDHLLDIGNGGFFNYDVSLARRVTAVDLFLDDEPGPAPNTVFRRGSLLDLPVPERTFDCVLVQNVFHHVTGATAADNHRNMWRGMQEIHRVLAEGGKAVILESTVGRIFHAFERVAYRPLLTVKRRGHPVTFQFTPGHLIEAAAAAGLALDEFGYVPRGWFVLQFGYRWPTLLTPARTVKLVFRR